MKLITNKFKTHAARQFLESFDEAANTIYYVAGHRSTAFSNDASPPDPQTSVYDTHYTLYDELVFGKHVTPNDVKFMIRNVPWVSGTVYDMYDDQMENLETKNFFVSSIESGSRHVFKCLNNNGGIASTDQPLFSETAPDDEVYITTDGYQWKYMYTVSAANYNKFATAQYIPVIENADVTANAVNGSIETIIIESPGSLYNSYASGTFKEAAVGGNTLLYSLNGDKFADWLIRVNDVTGFIEERVTSLNTNGTTARGVVVAIFEANNTVRVTNTERNFVLGQTLDGVTSSSSSTIAYAERVTDALSSDRDYYKNNSIYIRSGTGAGQLRTITEYIVSGDERRVYVNTPFSPLPTKTSIFEIGPRVFIRGDGANANAIVTVDPSANGIGDIEILNSGTGYTYADVTIIANTGLIDIDTGLATSTSSARARAIISPKGGHGSDIVNELYANRVGIGMQFANTENDTIPATNDYRKLSLMKDPLSANIELTIETSATNFTAGETVVQANTGATGTVVNRDGVTVRLSGVRGFFETGNSTVNYITGQSSSEDATVIAISKSTETFDQRQTFQVDETYDGPTGSGFILDELVVQSGLQQLASGLIAITLEESAFIYSDGEVVTQSNTGATGLISARYNNTLTLSNVDGDFLPGNNTVNYITGSLASVEATVTNVDRTIDAYATGYVHSINSSANLNVEATVSVPDPLTIGPEYTIVSLGTTTQNDWNTLAGTTGVVYLVGDTFVATATNADGTGVVRLTNSSVISLANVKGFFAVSDDASGTINNFTGQSSRAIAKITGRAYDQNYLVDGSGEFLYVEHFEPIVRADDQTEKVKLIIEF
jgi:hypothetical protein